MENKTEGKRYVSAPAAVVMDTNGEEKVGLEEIYSDFHHSTTTTTTTNNNAQTQTSPQPDYSAHLLAHTRHRNSSSPLPPISRLSSFNIDLSRVGLNSQGRQTPTSITPSSPYGPAAVLRRRGGSIERASTMGSSDLDGKEFASGDEDTDFKSDTMFDSIRTVASGRRRMVETPLESMFDETPPSTAGNSKAKRPSVQEMLSRSFEGEDDKITEEEESFHTPTRTPHSSSHNLASGASRRGEDRFGFGIPSPTVPFDPRDYTRLSFDDDDDEDWNRDDDNHITSHLSPPSNSINSRNVSPAFRAALATISGNSNADVRSDLQSDTATERPRSNVFDWTESYVSEKCDSEGPSPRPRTVHGKQELDMRGGRAVNRRGPAALHVRSQSVPVVPDQPENKSTPKFGTWATGKPASEDWDDDFDFEEETLSNGIGEKVENGFAMVIPTSIQASQPSVRAHSGQIREFSLLVNDLKRLCRLGREMDLMDGSSAALWKDAQGIIALASPDDDSTDDDNSNPSSSSSEFNGSADGYLDDALTGSIVNHQPSPPRERKKPNTENKPVIKSPRRRSVFSPEDDIFGTWPASDDEARSEPPKTPVQQTNGVKPHDMVARSVMEAVHQQQLRSASDPTPSSGSRPHHGNSRLNFDTNSLRELVKRASELRDSLSDLVRKADRITQSPIRTPRHQREESPAFTRVFVDPAMSPSRRMTNSHSSNSVLSRGSLDSSPSAGISQRMQVMTVN